MECVPDFCPLLFPFLRVTVALQLLKHDPQEGGGGGRGGFGGGRGGGYGGGYGGGREFLLHSTMPNQTVALGHLILVVLVVVVVVAAAAAVIVEVVMMVVVVMMMIMICCRCRLQPLFETQVSLFFFDAPFCCGIQAVAVAVALAEAAAVDLAAVAAVEAATGARTVIKYGSCSVCHAKTLLSSLVLAFPPLQSRLVASIAGFGRG